KNSLKNANFVRGNLLELPLKNSEKFDFVFAFGSLHHTIDPKKAFANQAEHVKPNGFVTLGLYNSFGRFQHRLRRKITKFFSGQNVDKRIEFAGKHFSNNKEFTELTKIYLADKYAHPNERYSSLEECFSWFDEFGFEFFDSDPKIKFNNPFLTQLNWFFQRKTFFFVSGRKIK
ncbi:MAG: methyltransferase domain-containing protein, partial [Candidatus Diapherotrites archaeon]|nr:methyltransferase domain-containing protein [Candidatus Diapherotrites archaeon]